MTAAHIMALGGLFVLAASDAAGGRFPFAYDLWSTPHITLVGSGAAGCKIDDMSGPSGRRIGLGITILPESQGKSGTLFLGGLPEEVVLTAGSKVNSLWAIPVKDADQVAILAPASFTGRFGLRLQCIIGGQQFEDTARIEIEVGSAETTRATVTTELPPRVINEAAALNSHPLMKQADDLVAVGDLARARLLYEHLAMKGSPRAAFSLGRTYDPIFLNSSSRVRGIAPDIELAARWYRLARDLGVTEASSRLYTLGK